MLLILVGPFDKNGVLNSESLFRNKYGSKNEFIDYIKNNNIKNENILWIVRAEHGGVISYFIDNSHFWERNWYDSPKFHQIHTAGNKEVLRNKLLEQNIKYIVSTDEISLERFFIEPFKNKLGFNEILLNLIEKNDSEYLQLLFREEKNKGLEFNIYKVNQITNKYVT